MLKLVVMMIGLTWSLAPLARAAGDDVTAQPQILRVGGDYIVNKIQSRPDGSFMIEFKAKVPSGKFDTLRLESDHVHVSVNEGQTLRLSAEISEVQGPIANVSQVMIFVPHVGGDVPVWLLSRNGSAVDLRGSKYLEMHNPMSDFAIF